MPSKPIDGGLLKRCGIALIAGCLLSFAARGAETVNLADRSMETRASEAMAFRSADLWARIKNGDFCAHWIGSSHRFWYQHQTAGGHEYLLVDAATGRQRPAFDHAALAIALRDQLGGKVSADALPITSLSIGEDSSRLRVTAQDVAYDCDLKALRCVSQRELPMAADPSVSPDAKRTVFLRDHNLWLRDRVTGAVRPLTSDGIEHFAYGDVDGYVDGGKVERRRAALPSPLPGTLWSQDGKFLIALRQDLRPFPDRLMVTEYVPPDGSYAVQHSRRTAIASDPRRPDSALTVIDVTSGKTRSVTIDPQILNDWALPYYLSGLGVRWVARNNELFLIGANRGGTNYSLQRINLETGASKPIIEESAKINVRLNPYDDARPNVYVATSGHEALWYSERDGWGHLYLYDVDSGQVKKQLTRGQWVVADLVRVDEVQRMVYFTAVGREIGRNPYFRHLYRVSMDGGEPQLLTPEDADHEFNEGYEFWEANQASIGASISPDGRYIVDSFSTADQVAQVVIRTQSGRVVTALLRGDDSELRKSGWRPPERFTVKADDDVTDLYGVIYKPLHFDPALRYPVIEATYPGPQGRFAPQSYREYFNYMNPQAFAELGFIVVLLDGRGTAYRSKAFRDAFLGTKDPFGSADHVAAIRNVAKSRPYMDLNRVGVTGHSFGGYGSLRAMLLHPDFYQVAVSGVGPGGWLNFQQSVSTERFFGVPGDSLAARQYYDLIDNTRLLGDLRGHLLLINGGIDEDVPLKIAFDLIDALVKADKPFDNIIVPDSPHHVGLESYAFKRSMVYFMTHLGAPGMSQVAAR